MPSLNHYWRHMILKTPKGPQVRVHISKEGRDYRRSVVYQIEQAGYPRTPIGARLAVALTLYPPDRRRIDIDNRIKAGLDALTHAGVWADDSLIDRLTVQRGPVVKGGRVAVTITALDATLFEVQV
ncbi:RusA family crossover junction endodeoxyribonuclease [Deinococcus altitudinis]|uniref:RusA family crossover junction endodeoxyribonuclease n=1 Tax=Deinococcus altitudinis TaxID=468914 RepID=UPI0038913152